MTVAILCPYTYPGKVSSCREIPAQFCCCFFFIDRRSILHFGTHTFQLTPHILILCNLCSSGARTHYSATILWRQALEELVGTTSLGLISIQLLMSSTAMVEDIKSWAASRQWSFAWCNREKNRASHWIATNCLSRKLLSFTGCIPPELDLILTKEVPS